MPNDKKRSDEATLAEEARAEEIAEAEIVEEALADRPLPPPPPPPAAAPERRRGGTGAFLGTVLGGILAAGAGFGLARVIPGGWPIADTSALETKVETQAQEIAALKSELAAVADRPVADASAEIAALRAELDQRLSESAAAVDPAPAIAAAKDEIQSAVAALDSRLTEIEKRPVGSGGEASASAIAAYERDLQDLRSQIAAQTGQGSEAAAQIEAIAADAKAQLAAAAQEAERLKSEAAAAARSVTTGAALGRIRAAFEGGGPYASAVSDLSEAGLTVPDEVAGFAETGVPTLTDLQRSFPAAAREALTAALRAQTGTGWADRLSAFLRTQTGARSLEPREGTDPDAILSRAEAALANGDVAATLTEIAALPDPAKEALAPWVADAEKRQAAIAALTALAAAANAE